MEQRTDASCNAGIPGDSNAAPAQGGQEPAAEEARHAPHKHHKHHIGARNVLALVAAVLFMAAIFVGEKHLLIKAIAYGAGALAYIAELFVITGAFKKHVPLDELFMPLLFGGMYIMLGLNYALEHHYFG